MASVRRTCLNHVSRESLDIKRLADFYIEIFGFEQVECPKFDFEVIWLKLGSSMYLHLIERDTNTKLPEGPWSSHSAVADLKHLPRGHHLCFYVPNFDSFVQSLKELKMLADQLSNVGSPVSNQHILQLIAGLNESYDSVATIIQQSDPLPQFYEARSKLILEETRKAKQAASAAIAAGAALHVAAPSDEPPARGQPRSSSPTRNNSGNCHDQQRNQYMVRTTATRERGVRAAAPPRLGVSLGQSHRAQQSPTPLAQCPHWVAWGPSHGPLHLVPILLQTGLPSAGQLEYLGFVHNEPTVHISLPPMSDRVRVSNAHHVSSCSSRKLANGHRKNVSHDGISRIKGLRYMRKLNLMERQNRHSSSTLMGTDWRYQARAQYCKSGTLMLIQ